MSKNVQCALAALLASLLGSAIVAAVTVAEWLAPTTPALLLLGAALIPALLAGLLTASPPDQQPWTQKHILTGAVPGLIFGLLAVALGFLWTQPQFRTNAAAKLPPTFQNGTPLLRALKDASPEVATQACKTLASDNFKQTYRIASETLSTRPTVALGCLQDDDPQNQETLLALTNAWHHDLTSTDATLDEQFACLLADTLAKTTIDPDFQTARLTHCALQAQDPVARKCCTQTLTQNHATASELAQKIDSPQNFLASFNIEPQLISASFSGQPKIGAFNLKTPPVQRLALLTSCQNLAQNPTPILTSLFQLAQSLQCLSSDQAPSTNLHTWARICESITQHSVIQPDAAPQDVFCNALNKEIERQEILAAEQQEILNQKKMEGADLLAGQIEYGGELSKPEDMQQFIVGLDAGFEKGRYSDESISILKQHLDTLNATPDAPDDDPTPEDLAKITPEALERMQKDLPALLNQMKGTGMSQEQFDSLNQIGNTIQQKSHLLLPK